METIAIVAFELAQIIVDHKQALKTYFNAFGVMCALFVISFSALVFCMSRTLQNDRAAREKMIEDDRAAREKMLEDDRAARAKMMAEAGQNTGFSLRFHSHDYRRQKPVAGEGQPATPARCASAAERRANHDNH